MGERFEAQENQEKKEAPKKSPRRADILRKSGEEQIGLLSEVIREFFQSDLPDREKELNKLKAIYDPEKKNTLGYKRLFMKAVGAYAAESFQAPQKVLDAIYGSGLVPFEVDSILPGEPWRVSLANMGVRSDVLDYYEEKEKRADSDREKFRAFYDPEKPETAGNKEVLMKTVSEYSKDPQQRLDEIYGKGKVPFEYPPWEAEENRELVRALTFSNFAPTDEIKSSVSWAKSLEVALGSLHLLNARDFDSHATKLYLPQWITGLHELGIQNNPEKPLDFEEYPRSDNLTWVMPLSTSEYSCSADLEYLKGLKDLGVDFTRFPDDWHRDNVSVIGMGLGGLSNWSESEKWPPLDFVKKAKEAGFPISTNFHGVMHLYSLLVPMKGLSHEYFLDSLKTLSEAGFDWSKLDLNDIFGATPFGVDMEKGLFLRLVAEPQLFIALKQKGGKEEDLNIMLHSSSERNIVRSQSPWGTHEERDFDFYNFVQDPAMPTILGAMRFLDAEQKETEMPLFIGRYLYNLNIDPTEAWVKEARTELEKLIKDREAVPVLEKGRGVTVIAHNEKLTDGQDRFGKAKMLERVEEVTGSKPDVLRLKEESGLDQLTTLKETILKAIVEATPPHTFIFNGHGSWDGFWLADLPVDQREALRTFSRHVIRYDEFADALQKRYEKFKSQPQNLEKDVFYFSACVNYNLVRILDEKLTVPYRPVFLTSGEFSQVSYSDFESETGNFIFDNVFRFKESVPERVTVGDFIHLQDVKDTNASTSNISVFVPYKGRAVQVGAIEKKNPPVQS